MMRIINPFKLFVGLFIPNWLAERSEVSQGAKVTYGRLCQFAGRDGLCYPSLITLGKELGISEGQARIYVKELKDLNLIHVKRTGLKKPNQYFFLKHDWMEPDLQSIEGQDHQSIKDQDLQCIKGLDHQSIDIKDNHINENHNKENQIISILFHWNSREIINHKKSPKIIRAIEISLKSYTIEQIMSSIDNYSAIISHPKYFFKYKWTLPDFLKRGLEKFLDFNIAHNNYLKEDWRPENIKTFDSWRDIELYYYNKYKNDHPLAIQMINKMRTEFVEIQPGKIVNKKDKEKFQ